VLQFSGQLNLTEWFHIVAIQIVAIADTQDVAVVLDPLKQCGFE
jgi:hypothetical protein